MAPIVWQATRWPATEYFELEHLEHQSVAKGNITGFAENTPFSIHYEIAITAEWKVSSFHVKLQGKEPMELKLTSDLHGHWFDKEGNHIDAFDDCIDIDISLTPFTNTLPVRRMHFDLNEKKTLNMLYIRLPEFELQKVEQHYTKLDDRMYLYENADSGFSAEIPFDEHALVKDYPGIFKRIY
ncbi:putative glycolipid-binding domain-containing protein [Chitinophaga solisilvae]|uniref:putative glycolipid-binding domain-containing protein n=1 Tax=Chitinophaga solisilvae TaxID=1233460 RepID=UPI00136A344B|nr:putative glycolipid-binding domain-containing protein [Chitinophaga solisilvae]